MKIRAIQDTVFKPSPQQSATLPPDELRPVAAGTELDVQDNWSTELGHVKFLSNEDGNPSYAWGGHVELFDGDAEIFPLEEQATPFKIVVTAAKTMAKRFPDQSSTLKEKDKIVLPKGTVLDCADADREGSHYRIIIGDSSDLLKGMALWYVFADHVEVWQGESRIHPPHPAPAKLPQRGVGPLLKMPSGARVGLYEPIIKDGSFFWDEATHGGDRIPQSKSHEENIIALAKPLQKAREQIGKPFRVTSWYRPDPWNRRAGGARRSQHLEGRGIDIVVEGYMGKDLAKKLVRWWPGGLGIYPGNRQHILHLDIGPKRQWGF